MLSTILWFVAAPAQADEITVAQAVSAGLTSELPQTPKGSAECACVVLDYGAKGTLKLTADQVTGLVRTSGKDPVLQVVVGEHRFRVAGGLCERVALLSVSVAQWLDRPVLDERGKPATAGCTAAP